jgi:phage terminase large subunit
MALFPDIVQFLFPPSEQCPEGKNARYKILYGGRGGIKSWSIARALLIRGGRQRVKILCARETQKSIRDSVHALLAEQIQILGLSSFYEVQKSTIIGRNGTSFIFFGLKHNVADIKSCEGVDIVWVEEAANVSRASWSTLIPTIRREGSEIWVSFNPELETDETYRRFVLQPQPDSIVLKTTYRDNPWFPDVLQKEMEYCREHNPDEYTHVWEGCCVSILEGAIYANELRKVDVEGRICRVPYDSSKPVETFWDLGWDDSTAIWFVQQIGFEFHVIDCLDGEQKPLVHYVKELQARPYVYGTYHLPHDAKAKNLGTGKSIEEQMRQLGLRVSIVPQLSVADGINAARSVFDRCWFDAEKCADGLQALRHYRYGERLELGVKTREPLHDWASHFGDSFRYFAVGFHQPAPKKLVESTYHAPQPAYSWMG